MLRAEADVFKPQAQMESVADISDKYTAQEMAEYYEDLCATGVPSPALTASSAWASPSWGYEDFDWNAQMMAGMWQMQQACGEFDEFALPDAEESEEAEVNPEDEEFALAGMDTFQSSLSNLLTKHIPSGGAEDSDTTTTPKDVESPSMVCAAPPGLDLPPGLEPGTPPGVAPPPGLDSDEASYQDVGKPVGNKEPILPDGCTTVMLRNIPNKYSQDRLVKQLHADGYKGDIDFLYLPIDFKNLCNVGYAFLNFRTTEACQRFASEYHHINSVDKLPGFKSKKICEVAEAACQGCKKNIMRLQNSPVMAQLIGKPEWMPRLFNEWGETLEFPSAKVEQSYGSTWQQESSGDWRAKGKWTNKGEWRTKSEWTAKQK